MKGQRLTCGLTVGDRVRYRDREWTVMGGPIGDNHPPESRDFLYLERDKTATGATVVGVRLADVEVIE